MGESSQSCEESRVQGTLNLCDPWRKRMRRSAERLRRLDERGFKRQIARIEECLRRDAEWNLEAALRSCDRWRAFIRLAD
jgi:hypothetical protein